jgi:hypothetical protein
MSKGNGRRGLPQSSKRSRRRGKRVEARLVGVRTWDEVARNREETRQQNAVFGVTGQPVHGLSDVEKQAAEMVRRVQGELPPW